MTNFQPARFHGLEVQVYCRSSIVSVFPNTYRDTYQLHVSTSTTCVCEEGECERASREWESARSQDMQVSAAKYHTHTQTTEYLSRAYL